MARSKRSVEKERFWRKMVEEQRQGGGSVRAFCRAKGISEPSFYTWRKELKKRDAEQAGTASRPAGTKRAAAGEVTTQLVPVEVVGQQREGDRQAAPQQGRELLLEIETPGGFTLRFDQHTTPEAISRLLEILARHPLAEGTTSC